jgi:hypothetical protein
MLRARVEKVFLLSPARAAGKRASMLSSPRAGFELARRLQQGETAPLSEIFTFLSGLYFRGKVAYARAFAKHEPGCPAIWVITSNRGLLGIDEPVSLAELRDFSDVDIDHTDRRYREPLERDARRIRRQLGPGGEVILLGSISTRKYVDGLVEVFGAQLKFPLDFVGRGDMSRGGLLLRRAVDEEELDYGPVLGAIRRGKRPPKLAPRRYTHLSGI